ncbi:MAG: bifunctional phosphoribosyl-AMP cyclohydrolase/phosphoribosyl-ATP diphosphatase HisIE [Proteobacteria bacterium]|nr:bifunctional phosphoribosyl-AMP cyclohydrolase/phosphoribosyl-ATP diphosphatase HisIE [Pseudomonadota bacterium]
MTSLHDNIDWKKGDGLVPAIVQHAVTGRVLMLGYMNAEALAATQSSELVTFYSRSRNCLWTKGETSGNKLKLRDIELDCDGDALLVTAAPTGPTCHLEKSSCFDHDAELPGFGFVGQLETIIEDRMKHQPSGSYTAQLVNAGVQRIAQKIGEEGVEVALAATQGDPEEIICETADLIYHVLVLLKHQGLNFADVAQQLEIRQRKI